jgi:outer membrane protein OmpA-like peptidoglycan-associated protein
MDDSARRRTRFVVIITAILLLLGGVSGLWWATRNRVHQLEVRLGSTERALEDAGRQLKDFSQDLKRTHESEQAARERAAEAEQKAGLLAQEAEESAAARTEAESAAERARREAEHARAVSEQARIELADLRRRRELELNRMQEALSRIAVTRRTPSGMVMELGSDSFFFDFDKADLRAENREVLSRIAGVLLASEGYRLFVYGHTDDIGTDEYNRDLSRRRADSVADYLVKAGVPGDIIARKGFGKSSPRVKQTTREAREKNRRVEIGIVDTIIDYGPVAQGATPLP